MLGIPSGAGAFGAALLVLGAAGAVFAWVVRGRPQLWRSVGGFATATLAVTLAAAPFLLWRIIEDMRYTTRLDAYQQTARRVVTGPVLFWSALAPLLLRER